jgi:hypothetical protein
VEDRADGNGGFTGIVTTHPIAGDPADFVVYDADPHNDLAGLLHLARVVRRGEVVA